MSLLNTVLNALGRALGDTLRQQLSPRSRRSSSTRRPSTRARTNPTRTTKRAGRTNSTSPRLGSAYPGDYTGSVDFDYSPHDGTLPDPGEVAWCWVPYEEDHSQGKDRPVLLVGRDGDWLLALPLTSKDHDRDEAQEASAGRHWMDIGTGPWDPKRRPSEVRLDRIIRVDPTSVRRTSDAIDRELFNRIAAGVRRYR